MTQANETWGPDRSPRSEGWSLTRGWATSSSGAALVARLVVVLLWAALVGLTLLIAP